MHKVHFYKSFHAKVKIIVKKSLMYIFVISITIRNVDKSLELQTIRCTRKPGSTSTKGSYVVFDETIESCEITV